MSNVSARPPWIAYGSWPARAAHCTPPRLIGQRVQSLGLEPQHVPSLSLGLAVSAMLPSPNS
eukprot:3986295-Amphidinium_carterae.1